MSFDELTIACVGARHPNEKRKGQPTGSREMEIRFAERGDPVELRPEPENKHDQNAIAVYSMQGVQMGYVAAERTILIRRAWEETRTVIAIFQERTAWGAWLRVSMDGNIPSLPPLVATQPDLGERDYVDPGADDDGFYPDYIPPDD